VLVLAATGVLVVDHTAPRGILLRQRVRRVVRLDSVPVVAVRAAFA